MPRGITCEIASSRDITAAKAENNGTSTELNKCTNILEHLQNSQSHVPPPKRPKGADAQACVANTCKIVHSLDAFALPLPGAPCYWGMHFVIFHKVRGILQRRPQNNHRRSRRSVCSIGSILLSQQER